MMAMSPIKFNTIDVRIDKDAPFLGEHNDEVLLELGYTKEEIIDFYAKDILAKK